MEGKVPDSNPHRQQQQQQQPPGAASNLDSFFKRLGQGQSSRLWAGPGRSGAAVPGSLRPHLHSRNDAAGDSNSKLPPPTPAAAAPGTAGTAASAAVATASSPRRGTGGVAAESADEWYGNGGSGVSGGGSTAINNRLNNNRASALPTGVGGDGAGGAGSGATGGEAGSASAVPGRAAGSGSGSAAASLAAGNDRRRQNRIAGDPSLSPLGTSGGMWSELDGGGGGGGGSRNRAGAEGVPGKSANLSRGGLVGPAGTTFGSGSGKRGGGGNGLAFGNSHVGDDPMYAPPSPSPVPPPPPPAATPVPMPSPPTQSPETPAMAAAKPPAKPAARPALKQPAKQPADGDGERERDGLEPMAGEGLGEGAEAGATAPTPVPALVARPSYRDKRFDEVLAEEVVKLDELRKISWNGVPPVHRAAVWQLLVGYMPANRVRRAAALGRKRREYREAVPQYFDVPDASRTHQEQNILRQILVDVPRTCPDVPFFHQEKVQRAMERILYIWAIRHPASGYVQGINDLLTPLYVVFLSAHVGPSVESKDVSRVDETLLYEVEADVYWCLTKLLDNIQDHYTAMQPGLQRMVLRLEELVQRIDADLHRHITEEGLMYIQFAFRWMNCLLLRELPQRAVVRAWDTYLAEENGFESFHVYVSAALLCHFSSTLREMDFQTMVMFLQDMPTKEWGEEEVEPLLSQAYILSTLFERSPNHLGAS